MIGPSHILFWSVPILSCVEIGKPFKRERIEAEELGSYELKGLSIWRCCIDNASGPGFGIEPAAIRIPSSPVVRGHFCSALQIKGCFMREKSTSLLLWLWPSTPLYKISCCMPSELSGQLMPFYSGYSDLLYTPTI